MVVSHGPTRNVLLVHPKTPEDTYWSFSHSLRMVDKKTSMPPLGLVTVAALLPPNEFTIRLVDMNVREVGDEELAWADTVMFSAMIVQEASLVDMLRRAKEAGKTTIAGGPFPSTAYRDLVDVDTFLIGEAESIWNLFLADFRTHNLKRAYAAPVRDSERESLLEYFGQDALIVQAASYPDVDLAPLPRFDLLDLSAYTTMTVQASRGCPVGCEFCDIWRRYGRKSRFKSPTKVLAELEALHQLGWVGSVFLVDDNFIGNIQHAKELLAAIVDWQRSHDWPYTFLTEATLSVADDAELLRLMVEARFASIFVGIETPSEASLRETKKHINLNGSLLEKAARIQAAGIEVMSGFIIGFDADPADIADRMTECIQDLGIPQAMIGLLTILPDTDLHDRLAAEDRVLRKTTGNNTHHFTVNYLPSRPAEEVIRDYETVLDRAYSADLKSYYERCAVLRDRWPRLEKRRSGLPLSTEIKALFRYFRAAATSSYRWNALRFVVGTLFRKPSFLPQAIELGIKGHHLWLITRAAIRDEQKRTAIRDSAPTKAAAVPL